MAASWQGCLVVTLGAFVGTKPGEHWGLDGSTTCQWSAMVSQFCAMFPFGNMQSSAVLLLQVPKTGKGRKNSFTDLSLSSIHACGRAVICLFVVFWEDKTDKTKPYHTVLECCCQTGCRAFWWKRTSRCRSHSFLVREFPLHDLCLTHRCLRRIFYKAKPLAVCLLSPNK